MKLINLTPHEIRISVDRGTMIPRIIISIPPSGVIARINTIIEERGEFIVAGNDNHLINMPLYETYFGEIEGLPPCDWIHHGRTQGCPPATSGTIYIVSRIVRDRVPRDRHDVVVPGESIRDETGRIVACNGLSL